MIAAILALAALQPTPDVQTGDWFVVAVHRVIAPDQIPGQCFLEAHVEQVVHGRGFRSGDAVAITMACRPDDRAGDGTQTIAALRSHKRALVRLDPGGRLVENGYYALDEGAEQRRGI
jgi:hypothetical protein